jgi:hypothetical protein
MTVKKKYNIDDIVWIYGITNGKSTEGKIVQWFKVPVEGWDQNKVHYVVAIPTEIEPLLEIRTWETISQTKHGRVGALRDIFDNPDAAHRMLARTGMAIISTNEEEFIGDGHDGIGTTSEEFDRYEEHIADEDNISPDEIHAALEKSQQNASHSPLIIKEAKPKRRTYPARKKKV